MRSPFLIGRCVVFALLTYFSLLTLVFASWNIYATKQTDTPVTGSAVLLIFDSCLLFSLVALSFSGLVFPAVKIAGYVAFECAWILILSMFEVGASISLVVNGPVLTCQLTRNWDVCASSHLLLPTVWLKSLILLGYLFLLLIAGATHSTQLPSIWFTSIYTVPWFSSSEDKSPFLGNGPKSIPDSETDSWSRYMADIASSSERKRQGSIDSIERGVPQGVEKAPWAANTDIRRGRDSPFTVRDDDSSTNSSTARLPLPARPTAAPVRAPSSAGSRFIERFRESRTLTRPGKSHFSMDSDASITPFPHDVSDHDQPIPLPRLSEWMRADAQKGISIHNIPLSP